MLFNLRVLPLSGDKSGGVRKVHPDILCDMAEKCTLFFNTAEEHELLTCTLLQSGTVQTQQNPVNSLGRGCLSKQGSINPLLYGLTSWLSCKSSSISVKIRNRCLFHMFSSGTWFSLPSLNMCTMCVPRGLSIFSTVNYPLDLSELPVVSQQITE